MENSGAQISTKLANQRKTILAVSDPIEFMPLELFGKSIFCYFEKLGVLQAEIDTIKGEWIRRKKEKVYGFELKKLLKSGIVIQKSRVVVAYDDKVSFSDGTNLMVQNIVWVTGFKMDFRWIQIDRALNNQQRPIHHKGVSPIKNLYFLGLPWLSCRGSALIGWVGQDAQRLIRYLIDK